MRTSFRRGFIGLLCCGLMTSSAFAQRRTPQESEVHQSAQLRARLSAQLEGDSERMPVVAGAIAQLESLRAQRRSLEEQLSLEVRRRPARAAGSLAAPTAMTLLAISRVQDEAHKRNLARDLLTTWRRRVPAEQARVREVCVEESRLTPNGDTTSTPLPLFALNTTMPENQQRLAMEIAPHRLALALAWNERAIARMPHGASLQAAIAERCSIRFEELRVQHATEEYRLACSAYGLEDTCDATRLLREAMRTLANDPAQWSEVEARHSAR